MQLSEQVAEIMANIFIVNPLTGKGLASIFATKPPMEQRVEKLEDMAMGKVS